MNTRRILAVLSLLSLLSTMAGISLYYHSARESALREAEGDLVARSQLLKDRVSSAISSIQMLVRSLALFEELQEALLNSSPKTIAQANRILDHFTRGLGLDVCYLIDRTGSTIASSNRDRADSFVGHNYSFRPYFVEAMEGKPTTYMALGVTSGVRGIYSSWPVRLPGRDAPIGVVVVKGLIADVERELSKTNGGIALLVHSSGIIFASSQPNWILNLFGEVTPEEALRIAETKQFGEGPWNWTGLKKKVDNQLVDKSGETYLVLEREIEIAPGWRLVYLYSTKSIFRKIVDPLVGITGYVALILCVFVCMAVIFLYRMAQIDIRSRKQAEEALRQSENRLRAIVEHSTNLFYSHDANHNLTYLSPQTRQFLGYEPEEALVRWTEFATDNPINLRGIEITQKAIDTGRRQPPYLLELQGKKGRKILVEVNESPVVVDGKTEAIVGSATDVTERMMAEEALRLSEQRYRALFEAAADAIYILEAEGERAGQIVSANSAAAEMHGYTLDELLTLKISDLDTPESAARLADRLERLLKGEVVREEVTHRKKDGTVFPLEINARMLQLGEQKFSLAVDRDITERKKAEEALKKSEELLNRSQAIAHVGSWELDLTANELTWSDEVYRIFGIQPREFDATYEAFLDAVHPDDRVKVDEAYKGSIREGKDTYEVEHRVVRKGSGEIRIVQEKCEHYRDSSGKIVRSVGMVQDITDRKKAQEELASSEEWYRSLVDRSFDGIFVQQGSKIVYANARLYEMLGCSAGELEGIDHWLIYHPDYQEVTRERAKARMRGEEAVSQYEVKLKRKDGSSLEGEISAMGVTVKGEPGVQVWVRDLSKRKRLEEVQRRLATAIEQAGEAIIITDVQGNMEYVNPAYERMTGYTREEAIGSLPVLLGEHGLDPELGRALSNSIAAGAAWSGRIAGRRKDDSLCEMDVTVSPVRDPGGLIVNLVGLARDITEEVQLQRQLLQAQKMEAIGTLAGGIAHDFNNLLQAVLGYSDLLLMKKVVGDPDRKKLEVIQQAARDGADLVGRILAFSRKAESKVRPIDLNEEIRRVEKLLRRTLPRMIQIDLVLAEDLRIIDADPAQIEQVLLNLGVNARHAMPDGGQLLIETSNVSLSDEYLRTHLGAKPGHYVLLTVSDTGVGMEPEVLDRIFEPFFTTKTDAEGTGLGLAMVHGIVTQHGGHIRCYSEPGIGTSFKIYFPVSVTELISEIAMTREMPAFGTETILLVDDDDRVREMGRQMIETGGYEVLAARSGEEALEMYAVHRQEIALIILDLIMPGMGGKRCLEELLRIDPNIRVLVATGYSPNGMAIDTEEGRARGFLNKPYDARDILAAIRKVLDEGHL